MMAADQEPLTRSTGQAHLPSLVALALAFVGTCGSVLLSVGMGLKACPLCFYQRSFAMSVLAVLLIGILADRARPALSSLIALPLAVAGLGVAAFHEYLVWSGVLECPLGLLGMGTAPVQSLALFGLLTAALAAGVFSRPREGLRPLLTIGAVALGLVLAWSSIISSPPLPPPPTKPYDPVTQPLDMCRPPFQGPAADSPEAGSSDAWRSSERIISGIK